MGCVVCALGWMWGRGEWALWALVEKPTLHHIRKFKGGSILIRTPMGRRDQPTEMLLI